MLKRIIDKEKIIVEERLIDLIASNCEKSFRDAAKLLEELVIQNKLKFEDAQAYLGIRSKESLLEILASRDLREALVWIKEFGELGGSVKSEIEQLLEELHALLLKKNGILGDDVPAVNLSLGEITFLIKSFNQAYSLLKNSPIELLPLEIAVVEFYNNKNSK